MRSIIEHDSVVDADSQRELRLLTEVQHQEDVCQRELARRGGIAVGMTNLLLHSLAQKGYVRISDAGWRRTLYSLTPEGISRKLHLTFTYIQRVLSQYSKVRETLRDELALEHLNAESRVAIYGTGEFAELVYLGLKDLGIEEIEVFSRDHADGAKFLGMRIQPISSLTPSNHDRIVLAVFGEAKREFSELRQTGMPAEKLIVLFGNSQNSEKPLVASDNS